MITDESLMTFGKYKGTKMEDVPAKYLIWLHENATVGKDLRIYLDDNLDVLRKQAKEDEQNSTRQ